MLGDKGNSLGSAGGSNFSGDGKGGQVNMSHVGGGTGNVLRQIDGKWTVVSKGVGAQVDSGGSVAPVRMKPAAVAPPKIAPAPAPVIAKPPPSAVPLDPQIPGRLQATTAAKAAAVQTAMATKSAREDALAAATHNMVETHLASNPRPNVGPSPSSVPSRPTPSIAQPTRNLDASLPGRAAEVARNLQAPRNPSAGSVGGPAAPAVAPRNPFDSVYRDPQMAGRLAETRRPGYGVPDLPIRGQTEYKTPGPAPAKPATANPTLQALNDRIHRNAGIAYPGTTGTAATVPSASLGAPLPAGPEGQAPGVVSTNPSVPIPRAKPDVGIGEALRALAPTKDQERARPANPIENAAVPGQVGTVLSQGLPQMAAPAETAQQKLASIMHQWTAAQVANNTRHLNTVNGDIRTLDPGIVSSVDTGTASPEHKPPVGTNAPQASVPSGSMFADIGNVLSAKVNAGMTDFHDASNTIDKLGGPGVVTGLSKFIQSLNLSPGAPGAGGKDGARAGGVGNSETYGSGNGTSTSHVGGHPTTDWQGKGFTDAEISHLTKLKGSKYSKELARLVALHAASTPGPAPDYTAMIHQYEADKAKILAGNGYGLIPI